MKNFLLIFICFARFAMAVPTTFYIDCAGGSDSNAGTKLSPWAHAPGMKGTVNGVGPGTIDIQNGSGGLSCGSSPCSLPGDEFIFKGGVTCAAGTFNWTIRETGTGSVIGTSAVYFGVDQTWFTGASWSRPIMDFGGSAGGNKCNPQITMAPVSFVIIDNLEFTNNYWDHTCNGGSNGTIGTSIQIGGATHSEFKNLYVHGWDHEAYAPNNTSDVCDIFAGTNSGNDNNSLHDSVIDGSDTLTHGYACVGVWGAPTTVYNMEMRYVPNGGIVEFPVDWHNNTIENQQTSYDPTQHNQAFEDNGSSGTFYFYNNVVRHSTNLNGIGVNFEPQTGATTYAFNNLIYDTNDSPVNIQPQAGPAGGTVVFENNTVELGADSVPGTGNSGVGTGTYPGCPTGMTGCQYKNNHFIGTNNQSTQTCQATCTDVTNLDQTIATANGQGYNISQTYPFSPTSGGSTIGTGTNLSSTCTTINGGNSTAGAACLLDAGLGVIYNTSNHTVTVPGRASNTIQVPWNKGAYFYVSGGGNTPPAPANGMFAGIVSFGGTMASR